MYFQTGRPKGETEHVDARSEICPTAQFLTLSRWYTARLRKGQNG
jgi:hypothetical protein